MLRTSLTSAAILAGVLYLSAGCSHTAPQPSADAPPDKTQTVEQYWPNGGLQLRREVLRAADGTLIDHGTYTRWHNNGRKEYEATFVQGKIHGVETTWHKNGQAWTETHYVDGQKHGARCIWNADGVKIKEEHYHDGKPHGTWTVWNNSGKIKAQQTYEHGQPKP
jgi:antitoxin component YwqK of YwqJK toxin-antitoxin module